MILRSGADEVRPGEVLVAPFTDPGWTPYFLNAAAVVVDTGGILSHGEHRGPGAGDPHGGECGPGDADDPDGADRGGRWGEGDGAGDGVGFYCHQVQ